MTVSKPTGRFTRFINEDKKFYANGRVKPRAFYPRPKEKTHISVFLTENLSESDIWALGHHMRIKPIVGRADLDACKVYSIGLSIIIDNKSTGHAKLGPFPEVTPTSDKEKKDEREQIAARLAYISNVKRYARP